MITPSFGLTATERVLPKLALDFTTASLDSRVTFTRTTGASNPATYVNSSGAITAATPAAGQWSRGDIIWNNAPSSGGYAGWICVTAGTPGTWKTFGLIS